MAKTPRLVLCLGLLTFGCAAESVLVLPARSSPQLLATRLPQAAGAFAPAHTSIEGDVTGAWVSDVDACGGCHGDVFAQQQASAHAYSSFNNPVYRYSVIALREQVGNEASKMCAGCHDVALLVDGAIEKPVAADDPRAHAGVTCRVCHGMSRATVDGNGSFTLSREKISLPRDGDASSLAAHKRSAKPIGGAAMCGSCHRGFLGTATGNSHFLTGMDELSGHQQSAYAGGGLGRIDAVTPSDCIGCHMPKVVATLGDPAAKDGLIASHRFTGGHTWLASMVGDEAQLAAQRKSLVGAATIDIAAASAGKGWSFPAEKLDALAGDTVEFDVVVVNARVGHRFPAGVLDAQDVFVAIEVRDHRDHVIAQAGSAHRSGQLDQTAHVLRALVADQDGVPHYGRDVQNFAAVVVNHTVAARDAGAVRYRFEAPAGAAFPITISAALIHRSRNSLVGKLACAESKTPRGVAFGAATKSSERPVLDPCAPQPLTEVARISATLAGRPVTAPAVEVATRLYNHSRALSHVVSERLDEARAPALAALALLKGNDTAARLRAKLHATLAVIAGRQGRTDEAIGFADMAAAAIGETPALAKIRGDALAKVWRWREAELAYRTAAAGAPGNSVGWRSLAVARGSLGDHRGALEATGHGLALSPRDADMLRVQSLALRALGAPADLVESAVDAADHYRVPDRAGDIRVLCAQSVPNCALERQPVHVHDLELVP